jgi:cytoskeleton protein RodZ
LSTGETPAPAPDPIELGDALRAAREQAGLTVEQVSASTRIRATLVRDLEAGRIDSSGGTVYARGHLKAVAQAVHADPAPLLARFDALVGAPAAAPVAEAVPVAAPSPSRGLGLPTASRPEHHGPRWVPLGAAAAAVLVVLLAVGLLNGPDRKPTQQAGSTPTATATPAPTKAAQPPGPSAVARVPQTTGAALRVRVIGGASWVSVRNKAGTLFEGVLQDGTAKDFSDAKQLKVVVGNAGAVSLVCGGKDVPAGDKGSVRRYTCGASGLAPA